MTRYTPGIYVIRNANGDLAFMLDNVRTISLYDTMMTVNVRNSMYITNPDPSNFKIEKVGTDYYSVLGAVSNGN